MLYSWGRSLREVVISSFHGVCHLQRPEMTVKLLKLTSHVLKTCKCHPHIPVLNTMTLIRLKYFNPQATKPFCTREGRDKTEASVYSEGDLLQQKGPGFLLLKLQSIMSLSSMEIFFYPRNISFSSPIWCSIGLRVNVNHWSTDRHISEYQSLCCPASSSSQILMFKSKGEKLRKQNLTSYSSYSNEKPMDHIPVIYCRAASSVGLCTQDCQTFLPLEMCGWKWMAGWYLDPQDPRQEAIPPPRLT